MSCRQAGAFLSSAADTILASRSISPNSPISETFTVRHYSTN
jgi:hypothetical protein